MARREVREAERRIYHPRGEPWDGRWTVVVNTSAVAPPARAAVRQHLSRLGFSALEPVGSDHALRPDRGPPAGARRPRPRSTNWPCSAARSRRRRAWRDGDLAALLSTDLKALEPAWRKFLRRFRPLADAVDAPGAAKLTPESAFLARTLLIHGYRRIVLREPELPAGLWPPAGSGDAAYDVAARCYHALAGPAEAHLLAVCEAGGAPLLPARPRVRRSLPGARRRPAGPILRRDTPD